MSYKFLSIEIFPPVL